MVGLLRFEARRKPGDVGLRGARVGQSADERMAPVRVEGDGARMSLDVMSIGFMLPNEQEPVVLRGPRKDGVVRQFLAGVSWGSQDCLLIDTPPGTSDEHLSLVSALSRSLSPESGDGAIVVSTPAAVSLVDVRKELAFCKKQGLPVLGVVENMAPLTVPLSSLRVYADTSAHAADVTEEVRRRFPEIFGDGVELCVGVDVRLPPPVQTLRYPHTLARWQGCHLLRQGKDRRR